MGGDFDSNIGDSSSLIMDVDLIEKHRVSRLTREKKGDKFTEFLTVHNLITLNDSFPRDMLCKYTFHEGRGFSTIDLYFRFSYCVRLLADSSYVKSRSYNCD